MPAVRPLALSSETIFVPRLFRATTQEKAKRRRTTTGEIPCYESENTQNGERPIPLVLTGSQEVAPVGGLVPPGTFAHVGASGRDVTRGPKSEPPILNLLCQGAVRVRWTGLGWATPDGGQARIRSHRPVEGLGGWGGQVTRFSLVSFASMAGCLPWDATDGDFER